MKLGMAICFFKFYKPFPIFPLLLIFFNHDANLIFCPLFSTIVFSNASLMFITSLCRNLLLPLGVVFWQLMSQMQHAERDYHPLVWRTQKLTARLTGSFYWQLLALVNIFLELYFLRRLFINQLQMARSLLTAWRIRISCLASRLTRYVCLDLMIIMLVHKMLLALWFPLLNCFDIMN